MFEIINKIVLNPTVTRIDVYAPLIVKKAKPGQFVILRVAEDGERIPLTIADRNIEKGTISLIFQIVGSTTFKLNQLGVNDSLCDLVGPLGKPSEFDDVDKVIVVGGGVGSAIAYPIVKELHSLGKKVITILGFRNKELVILEDEFKACSDQLYIMTDDGSYQGKGLVTDKLKEILSKDTGYDRVFAVGPLIMMKFVAKTTLPYQINTIVSMNPLMIDGTGMCGGCRVRVDNEIKFACVDGPDFDGHKVDFDDAIKRSRFYSDFERHKYEETCNLFKKEVDDVK
ncbi:MAG: sulfide/dihydroorotate dehydrogenase-like FAD/NAD-binding protein [Erysipelotrichaceae bacterium]|nr:sulfide/dihydroorotate dehydrogenase-like FAD/NAD-binding protein [Erysipelotrichaceae bacterium]